MAHRGRKACAALLVVALGGLAVDRLFLGGATGPETANAAAGTPSTAAQGLNLAGTLAPREPGVAQLVARRLESMRETLDASGQGVPDAFADIFQVVPYLAQVDAPEIPDETPSRDAAIDRFMRAHRLQMVLVPRDGGEPKAVINGQSLVLGQTLDGARLVEIGSGTVTFELEGQKVVLALTNAHAKADSAKEASAGGR